MHCSYLCIVVEQRDTEERGDLENRTDLRTRSAFFYLVERRAANPGTFGQFLRGHATLDAPNPNHLPEGRKSAARDTRIDPLTFHRMPQMFI